MLAAVNERTKLIIVCNPNNPTGTLTPTATVAEWIDEVAADESDETVFLIDEAYFELVDDANYETLIPRARNLNDVLVVRTFSKIYGMAGMRLGYGVGNARTVQHVTEWIANNNTNQLAMAAASASLDDDASLGDLAVLVVGLRHHGRRVHRRVCGNGDLELPSHDPARAILDGRHRLIEVWIDGPKLQNTLPNLRSQGLIAAGPIPAGHAGVV